MSTSLSPVNPDRAAPALRTSPKARRPMHTTVRMKACVVCGELFQFTRSDKKTCGRRCSKRLERLGGKPPELPGDEELVFYRPRSLQKALEAVEHYQPVPLEALVLSDTERDVLVASSTRFSTERRLEAAGRLVDACAPWARARSAAIKLGWNPRDRHVEAALEGLMLAALGAAKEETIWCGVWKLDPFSGRAKRVTGHRRVAPYVPAQEAWAILRHDFLPRQLGRLLRAFEEEHRRYKGDPAARKRALSLDGPAGSDEDGNARRLAEAVLAGGEPPTKREERRGFAIKTALLHPERQALWGASETYFEALRLRLGSGAISNPDLNYSELEEIRREVKHLRPRPLPHLESDHMKKGDQVTIAEKIDALHADVREIKERLGASYDPVEEAEAVLTESSCGVSAFESD
jgi:hypothetical protein